MKTANYNLVLDKGWKFHLGQVKRFSDLQQFEVYTACKAGGALGNKDIFVNKNYWQDINVPHDWQVELPLDPGAVSALGYKRRGEGWYYITFKLPENPIENARLVFDGVLGQSVVYVNGTVAVRNFSGYNRFTCEIGSYLLPGEENMIAMYVDASVWEGWWYEGAGLYRPVYIEFREEIHFDSYDCFIRGQEKEGAWEVAADLKILGLTKEEDVNVRISLKNPEGAMVHSYEGKAENAMELTIPVENPILWSPESPELYAFVCELMKGAEVLETLRVSVGLRTITWCPDTGMHLNGKPYTVKGICCHQDHAGVGVATSAELIEYRISRLKEFGINAYRCAHHAPTEEFLEICDRLGMMVMSENRHYSVSEDVLKQLESMVKLSRNHPCVFIYSLFNEEPWQEQERGYRMARQMRQHLLALDDTRAVTAAMNGGVLTGSNASDALDVVGINYFLFDYDKCHERTPDKAILGTENCPTFATRGEYFTDDVKQVYNSYGDHWASFGESIEECMSCVEEMEYNAGCFAWSGFDYYGEPEPLVWPSVIYQGGIMDLCGFEKDTAYELAAWYKEELNVHLMPHWNWNPGDEVRVCAFTNAETAELFVNGRSVGEKKVNLRRAEWKVPFEAGSIKVKVRKGEEELFEEIHTAGAPAKLVVEDVTPKTEGNRIHIINVSVTDENGILISDFSERVYFDVRKIKILGVGNGNPNGHQPNVASDIELFHGRAQLIVTAGEGTLTVRCDGLPSVELWKE